MGSVVTVSGTHALDATTAQELIRVTADATNPFLLRSARIGQDTEEGDSAAEMLRIVIDRNDGTTEGAAGGAAASVNRHELGMPTPGVTGYVGSTTLSTTRTTIIEEAFNLQAGYLYMPTPEEIILFGPGESVIFGLPVGPADEVTFYCSVTVEELLIAT